MTVSTASSPSFWRSFRALGEEPGRVGAGRVGPLAAFDHLVEAVENAGVQRPGRILRHGLTPYISMIPV